MSEEFFPGLKEFEAERVKQKDKTFDVRILKKIIKQIDSAHLQRLMDEAGSDFGLDWFNETQYPPVLLTVKKLNGVTLGRLLSKTFVRGDVAQAYFENYESYGAAEIGKSIGVVFTIDSSPWVITDATIEFCGSAYVKLDGNSDDVPSLSVLRLDDLIVEWKRQGFVF